MTGKQYEKLKWKVIDHQKNNFVFFSDFRSRFFLGCRYAIVHQMSFIIRTIIFTGWRTEKKITESNRWYGLSIKFDASTNILLFFACAIILPSKNGHHSANKKSRKHTAQHISLSNITNESLVLLVFMFCLANVRQRKLEWCRELPSCPTNRCCGMCHNL